MTETLLDGGGGDVGGSSRAVRVLGAGLVALVLLFFLLALPLIAVGGVFGGVEKACSESMVGSGITPAFPHGSGTWIATSYGPPWTDGNGSGVTATGVDLRPARPAYLVAVDPTVIPLRSYVHVWPNPFGRRDIAFYAGDTGGVIKGNHIDIYDWRGRSAQNAWGVRNVTVTPAKNPGTGNVLGQVPTPGIQPVLSAETCSQLLGTLGPPGRLGPTIRLRAPRHLAPLPAFAIAPGFGPMTCDARIIPDVVTLVRRYGVVLTACYGIHSEAGEHPLGAAADIVPANGDWSRTLRLAHDLGWKESCAASGVAPACASSPFRFIGYNGYPSHGDPAHCPPPGCPPHIHLSWLTSASQGEPENQARSTYFSPSWIDVFDLRGGKA